MKENRANRYYACLFNFLTGESHAQLIETVSYIICCKRNKTGLGAMLYLNRTLLVMDMERLRPVANINITGAGAIITLEFHDNMIYFSPGSRYLTRLQVDIPLPSDLDVVKTTHEGVTTVKTEFECISKGMYSFAWISLERELIVCEENGIHCCSFPRFPSTEEADIRSVVGHSTTCCGISINSFETLVCTGDFTGQLFVWSLYGPPTSTPLSQLSVVIEK